jgi:hypothetical protein
LRKSQICLENKDNKKYFFHVLGINLKGLF